MASLASAYLDAQSEAEWLGRIGRIAPDARPRWGSMAPAQLIPHLRRSIELSLGEVPVRDESIPVVRTLMRWMTFTLPMPWPKGRIKAPACFFPDNPGELEHEQRLLNEAMARFTKALADNPQRVEVSQLFGPLTLKTWARIHGRHMEHHCRQFSV